MGNKVWLGVRICGITEEEADVSVFLTEMVSKWVLITLNTPVRNLVVIYTLCSLL